MLSALCISPIDSNSIKILSGEVRFIRGYYYFNLVRFFGGVPIVKLCQMDQKLPILIRHWNPGKWCNMYYKDIIPDMQYAMNTLRLKGQSVIGRITKGTAESMLAKVYMYLKNWHELTADLKT